MPELFYKYFDVCGPNYRFLTLSQIKHVLGFNCVDRQVRGIFKSTLINGGYLCPGSSLGYNVASLSLRDDVNDRLAKTYLKSGVVSRRPLAVILADTGLDHREFNESELKVVRRCIGEVSLGSNRLRREGDHAFIMYGTVLPERWQRDLAARILLRHVRTNQVIHLRDIVTSIGGDPLSVLQFLHVRLALVYTGAAQIQGDYVVFPWVLLNETTEIGEG